MSKFKLASFSPEISVKFKCINLIVLTPVIIWPGVFLGSMYVYEHPKEDFMAFALFLLMNLYPLFLCILLEVNARIYKKYKKVGHIIPSILFCIMSFGVISTSIKLKQDLKQIALIDKSRKGSQYIGKCKTYRSKDNVIYYNDHRMKADPNTFQHLSCKCGKDKNIAFIGEKPIKDSHSETFAITSRNKLWQKDKFRYYFRGKPIVDIDYDSFEIVSSVYGKDKFRYYYKDKPIEDIDYESFEIVSTSYSKDKFRYYYENTPKEDIDYDSFEIVSGGYAKDKYHVYYSVGEFKVVKNADPFTFEVNKKTRVARDKNTKYKSGKIIGNR